MATKNTKQNGTIQNPGYITMHVMEAIVVETKGAGINGWYNKNVLDYVGVLSKHLKLETTDEYIMLSHITILGSDRGATLDSIAEHLSCTTAQILLKLQCINSLIRCGLVQRSEQIALTTYNVNWDKLLGLSTGFLGGNFCYPCSNNDAFWLAVGHIIASLKNNEITLDYATSNLESLLDKNEELDVVIKIWNCELFSHERLLLLYLCYLQLFEGVKYANLSDVAFLYDTWYYTQMQYELRMGTSWVIKQKLVCWYETRSDEPGIEKDMRIGLTSNARKILLGEMPVKTTDSQFKLIAHDSIPVRGLFYDPECEYKVNRLEKLLLPENYNRVISRLQDDTLRTGFACIFYGPSGTGKTETVLQLARRTGRDIMQVNMSEMRSIWYGGSEQLVKQVFDKYRDIVAEHDISPILLFNEADAIFGKRNKSTDRYDKRTDNSIQNIILQEMETLDGILIATTNLETNMDEAFERRFLYKIYFDHPTVEARTAIWMEKLRDLSESAARFLAERYELNGAQIENGARRYKIDSILDDVTTPTVDLLVQYCDAEQINSRNNAVGYKLGKCS